MTALFLLNGFEGFSFFQFIGQKDIPGQNGENPFGKDAHGGFIAQGLEHWSCKPGVVSSNLTGAYIFSLM